MRITVIFGRFGRADQSSSVLMDADHGGGDSGCWLCFTALFSSSALSGRKPLPHIFFLLPRVLLGALLTHCGSFRMRPPPPPSLPHFLRHLHRSNQKHFLLPSQVAQLNPANSTAGTTIDFLLPRTRCFPLRLGP